MKRKIRFGIIGCGDISRKKYFKVLKNGKDYLLESVCDIDEKKAKSSAEEYGVKSWYRDYNRMLNESEIDAVLINTPHYLHAEPVISAAKAKKNILVEKPMAINMVDIEAMINAVKEAHVKLVVLPFDYSESFFKCKDLLRRGIIGEVVGVEGVSMKSNSSPAPWFVSKKAGIGCIVDIYQDLNRARHTMEVILKAYESSAKSHPIKLSTSF